MDEDFMRMALAMASEAQGELPVGAVIVRNGQVIARAHNERERTLDPTAHAEILALRRAADVLHTRRLTDCTLYVTLEPCPMCAGAIVAARLARLVYGAPDLRAGCAGSIYRITEDPAFDHFCRADGPVLADECQRLLHAFFATKRREV